VRQAVPAGAVLVEFVSFQTIDPRVEASKAFGAPRYVGFLLQREAEPQWVELGEAASIDAAVAQLRSALRDPTRQDVTALARALDERVMRPVRALLGSARQLLISPDGQLTLLPFAALVDEQNRYAVERYEISYLTSGRDLLRLQARVTSRSAPVILANPDFAAGEVAGSRGLDLKDVRFRALPASEAEAREIGHLLPDARLLVGTRATEAALDELAGPRVLHLATHGFFVEGEVQANGPAEPAHGFEGLLRSGIALAGANRKDVPSPQDGLVTALEFASLDLWGTKLVVLSACETGLGEVRAGEGVYGLRRAMVLAGSETQVMSLWKIDDHVTAGLMVAYYKQLLAGAGRAEAMRHVQLELLKDPKRGHPAYWASFIVSGDWTPLR
jgi:CHAT domain-containing protein